MRSPVPDWWRGEHGDRILAAIGWALVPWAWIRERQSSQRLADMEIPNGILVPSLIFARIGQRRRDRAFGEFGETMRELGSALGTRMRETDERQKQLVDLQANLERLAREGDDRERQLVQLQASVEHYTRWLLRLTIVLGIIGLAGIGATLWAALKYGR